MNLPKSAVNKISPISIGDVLERDRLFALLSQDSPTNAFWISGPGGSGKTTLIASFLKKEKKPCLWYQVDALDGDPATFFYYFGQAAASLLVSADVPMPMLTPEYLPDIDVFFLRYFETLYQRIEPYSWVIFDNFQDAPDESVLPQLLAVAVKQVPPHITIAIISRSDPPPIMARFIANRTMKLIDWSRLAFTPDEFTAFLRSSEYLIAADDADRLYRLTKGWIAGAILWLLHRTSDLPSTLPADQTPDNIFDYFVAEILEKSGSETRDFLLQTALLPHMTADMASELTGMAAENILETLYRKNFFLEKRRLSVASYQYHPLFRKFLLLQGRRIFSADALRTTRCHAAGILERQGLHEEAISLYSQAKAYKQIEAITLSQAQELVIQGRNAVLSAWIDILPQDSTEKQPYLLFWKGVALLTSAPQESIIFCTRAYELFIRNNDLIGQVLSWSMAIEILAMSRSGFTALDRWIKEGDRLGRLLPDDADTAELAGRFAAGMLVSLLIRNQAHPDIEKWQVRCEALLDRCCSPQVSIDLMKNLCWSYFWRGQTRMSLKMEARLRLLQNIDKLPPLQQILIYALLALSYVYRGDHRECYRMVNESLDIAEKSGVHVFDFMTISSSAFSWLGMGDLIKVPPILGKLKAALTSYAVWDHAQYHWLVAWHAIQADNLVEAQEQIETAVKLINICGNHFTVALCRILQSQIFLELGEPRKSENLLVAVQSEPQLRNSKIIHFLVNLAHADATYVQNLTVEAELYCKAAFAAAREESGIWMPLSLSNRRLGAVCARALEAGIEEDTVVEMIRRWQLKPPDPVVMSELWPWPVRIYALGRFEIHCDGKPLTLSAKTPRKPLELLTLLICAGQAGIFREAVAGRLWPDSDGDLALQTLNTTLHRLRKLLGYNETVVQKGSQLFLNGNLCWVDCRYFQWQVQQIESTTHQDDAEWFITRSLALYQGPFTTGHEHLSVAVGYSSQLNRQWLNVVAAAVPLFIRPDTGNETKRAVQQALADDDTAAAVFQILVSTFNKKEKGPEALKISRCCRNLLAEQGISFGRKTMAFFSNLRQK